MTTNQPRGNVMTFLLTTIACLALCGLADIYTHMRGRHEMKLRYNLLTNDEVEQFHAATAVGYTPAEALAYIAEWADEVTMAPSLDAIADSITDADVDGWSEWDDADDADTELFAWLTEDADRFDDEVPF